MSFPAVGKDVGTIGSKGGCFFEFIDGIFCVFKIEKLPASSDMVSKLFAKPIPFPVRKSAAQGDRFEFFLRDRLVFPVALNPQRFAQKAVEFVVVIVPFHGARMREIRRKIKSLEGEMQQWGVSGMYTLQGLLSASIVHRIPMLPIGISMRKVATTLLGGLILAGLSCLAVFFTRVNQGELEQSLEKDRAEVADHGGTDDEGEKWDAGVLAPSQSTSPSRRGIVPNDYPVPGPKESPLARVPDVLDAFLRAKSWEEALPVIYRSDELAGRIGEYYAKQKYKPFPGFAIQLFQIERDPEMNGPYWVYLVNTSEEDQGLPVIVRAEGGYLKVDWEIYSEFRDRWYGRYLEGDWQGAATFRVVAERKEEGRVPDKDTIPNPENYLFFELNAPYGGLNEFSRYALVESGTELAVRLDEVLGIGDEPLAVIVTLGKKKIGGTERYVITDYVADGWFR